MLYRLWPVLIPNAFIASAGGPTHTQSCTFEANLQVIKLTYLRDHVANGMPILPATAFFELAMASGVCLYGEPQQSIIGF